MLCVAGRGPLDEAAALLLVDMLAKYGIAARVVSSDETSATHIRDLACDGVQLTCVSYLEPGTFKNARYQVRRLRKRMPDVPVMALFWGLAGDNSRYLDGIEATECDIVTTGLKETVQHIITFARRSGRRVRAAAIRQPSDIGCASDYGMHADHHADAAKKRQRIAKLLIEEKLAACVQLYADRKLLYLAGKDPE